MFMRCVSELVIESREVSEIHPHRKFPYSLLICATIAGAARADTRRPLADRSAHVVVLHANECLVSVLQQSHYGALFVFKRVRACAFNCSPLPPTQSDAGALSNYFI